MSAPSVWDVIRFVTNPLKFKKWPNPINWIVDVDEIACTEAWYAEVEFAFATFAQFFWTNFVPQPAEIFRKTAFGTYRCGFYLIPGFKSPLEVVWGQGTQRILVKLASPVVTGFWYWWAASTAVSAWDWWQTVFHREEACIKASAECVIEGGSAAISGAHTFGGPGFGTIVVDPYHIGSGIGVDIICSGKTVLWLYCHFTPVPDGYTNVFVAIDAGGERHGLNVIGAIAANTAHEAKVKVEVDFGPNLVFARPYFEADRTQDLPLGSFVSDLFAADTQVQA